MIGSLLVANRGEIAVRILRACRRFGIRTIAVYSDADREARHVAFADEALRIGPAPARESYLRADAILEAAARSGAQAIHPGYGFLSETPELARLCAETGRVFVGPSAECIVAMGAKIGAKRIAAAAGVPSVPGYLGDDQSTARLAEEGRRIGFPVMIKASAGGGGKGMRQVFEAAALEAAIGMARREAEAAFGDPALLIEKLVARPRHLEVQIAGDKHGHVVHLFERDCSVQRNHQKILEEAPAPNLDANIREKLHARAIALARAIGYDNLGTVEFILEEGADEPWFLEMNTRLQVEHTVTEAITGFDLVEWQIRIASGEPLPATQAQIRQSGCAIEARITAERADQNFRPDAGVIVGYREPATIRVDSGIGEGSQVTLYYDSLLAKAIAGADTRDAARKKLIAALRDFVILGPSTNMAFVIDALDHPIFAEAMATTRFIDDAFPQGWAPPRAHARLARAAAALLAMETPAPTSAWTSLAGFRVIGVSQTRLIANDDGGAFGMSVRAVGGERRVFDAEGEIALRLRAQGAGVEIETDGHVLRGMFERSAGRVRLTIAGETYEIAVAPEIAASTGSKAAAAGSGALLAPMPGVVAQVKVAAGDTVEVGEVVLVLESMKLFTSLAAGIAGVVVDIACAAGETVAAGKRLMLIEPTKP